MSRIAENMKVSVSTVTSCFQHRINRHGKPVCFTVENISKLNESLGALSEKLRSCVLKFGTGQIYTNKHGRTYDPGMIEPINQLGMYLNMTSVMERLLGWNKKTKERVFGSPSSNNFGHISEEDVKAINIEIISVASFLDSVEVIPDENAFNGNKS